MSESTRTYNTSDFIRAWLSQRQYRKAHVNLKSYHEAAFKAFSMAFGIDLDEPPESNQGFPGENGLHRLFFHVARRYEDTDSPFSGYMCGSREIVDMYQKFGPKIDKAIHPLREVYFSMMIALMERIWGQKSLRTFTRQELEACGHPGWDAPDPVDYW